MTLLLLLAAACWASEPKAAQLEYLRGQLLERQGSYPEALRAYEKALGKDPQSAYVSREAAQLALELGQYDKALQWAKKVVELQPGQADSLVLLGRVQAALGDTEVAEKSFQAALKLDPQSVESVFSLAGLLAGRNPEEARRLFERFIESNPAKAAEAHFQLARLELQLGRTEVGRKHLKQAIALDAENEALPARYALAQTYANEHSTDAALAEYVKILKLEPQNVALLDRIAQLYLAKGDWEAMRQTLLEAKAAQNDDPEANHWLALYCERKSDWAKAADYVRASAAFSEDPALSMRLGYYLTQDGRLAAAVSVLEAAQRRWPDNDQVAYFLALGYDDLKRYDDAVKLLRRVVELKPDFREARFHLGVLFEKTGRMAEAEIEFRRQLVEKPDDAAALNYLGYSLADRGLELEQAEGYIRRAVALDPRNGAYLDSLGWVHYKLGRSTEAVAELRKAADALPEDDTVLDHLGDAYAAGGDVAAAWRVWKRASPEKAARTERRFSTEQLGGLYLDYLKSLQGGIRKLSGLCEMRGKILGREFSYRCLVTFRTPDELEIELLGPLFTPVFRIKLNDQGFVMDPLNLEGVDPRAVTEAAYNAVALMRQYLSGRLFDLGAARYKKKWWRGLRWLELPGWRLTLDRSSTHVEQVVSLQAPG